MRWWTGSVKRRLRQFLPRLEIYCKVSRHNRIRRLQIHRLREIILLFDRTDIVVVLAAALRQLLKVRTASRRMVAWRSIMPKRPRIENIQSTNR